MSTVSETTVIARKRHWCDEYGATHRIEPGDTYVRSVAFPDGEINTSTVPWVLKLCADHWAQYGRELPPRRSTALRQSPGSSSGGDPR